MWDAMTFMCFKSVTDNWSKLAEELVSTQKIYLKIITFESKNMLYVFTDKKCLPDEPIALQQYDSSQSSRYIFFLNVTKSTAKES